MIASGDELSAILKRDSVGALDHAPVREDFRLHIPSVRALTHGAVDCLAHTNLCDLSRGAVSHQHARVTPYTIDATMAASPIGVDGLLEWNIRRIIRGDNAARSIWLERRGNALGFRLGVPPVEYRLEVRTLEAARGIRKGASSLQSVRSQRFARHR
jgi:hypothetical protein